MGETLIPAPVCATSDVPQECRGVDSCTSSKKCLDAQKALLFRIYGLQSKIKIPQVCFDPGKNSSYGVDFFDEKTGCVVGEKGFMAKTADGGKTWTKVKSGTTERLNAVQMVDKDVVYAVGENGTAIGTNDGGKKIVAFRTDTKRDLKDLSFIDKHNGFVVGSVGTVLQFVRDY